MIDNPERWAPPYAEAGAYNVTFHAEATDNPVGVARDMAGEGDVVLLSPACTSFDAYANFEERGEEFRRLVRSMAEEGR